MPEDKTLTAAYEPRPESNAIAPAWHTAVLLLFLTAFALLTLHIRAQNPAAQGNHRVHGYLLTMAFEWLMVAFIAWGARFGGASLRTLAGAFTPTGRSVLRDLGIAIAYLLVAQVVLGIVTADYGAFHSFRREQGAPEPASSYRIGGRGLSFSGFDRRYLRRDDFSRLHATPVHRVDRERRGRNCAARHRLRHRPLLPGARNGDCDCSIWMLVRHACVVAQEPATGHGCPLHPGRNRWTCIGQVYLQVGAQHEWPTLNPPAFESVCV
jgi:hypothetical protein